MRYSKDHKAETRARIVKNAAVRLREKGARGVGVADLMKQAGLTHGGFYAHFKSREALLVEAFVYAMDRSTERWRKFTAQQPPEQRFAAIVNQYLTARHRDDIGSGCAVPALAADIARETPRSRKAFTARVEAMIDMLADQMNGVSSDDARQRAMAALSTMMGALVLSRVAGDTPLSDEILAAGRDTALTLDRRKPLRRKPPARIAARPSQRRPRTTVS